MEKLLSRHRARVPVAELVGLLATGLISCSTDGSAAPSDELSTTLYLYTEVHIDDFALEPPANPTQPANPRPQEAFSSVSSVISRLTRIAEAHGHRLSIHTRMYFAGRCVEFEGKTRNTLLDAEARGHEVGTHCHQTECLDARNRVNDTGVKANWCIVPGLFGSNPEAVVQVFHATRELGFRYYTDSVWSDPDETRMNAMRANLSSFLGLHPWRPNDDLTGHDPQGRMVSIDLSVNPWDWKLALQPDLIQTEYLTRDNFDDLRPLVERQLTRVEPGKVNYFGFSFHEHQFTEQDRDVPRPVEAAFAAFDAFLGWMDALVGQGRVQYATAADIYRAYLDWEKK
jgi:hypothetical protein